MALSGLTNSLLATVCLQLLLSPGYVSASGGQGSLHDGVCAEGKRQSPVDFTSQAIKNEEIPKLVFDKYDIPFGTLINTTSYNIDLLGGMGDNSSFPSVREGNLSATYLLSGIHFHWGLEGEKGSEHRLEGRQFDAELHMVHYKASYNTLAEAMRQPDGLAVLGTWLQEADETVTKDISDNAGYQWMEKLSETVLSGNTSTGSAVSAGNDQILFQSIAMKDLMTTNPTNFFRYFGSLTVSPCAENVIWTMYRHPITVPKQFMKMLRLKQSTVRPPVPLHGRSILYGGGVYYSGSGLPTTPTGLWVLSSLLALYILVV